MKMKKSKTRRMLNVVCICLVLMFLVPGATWARIEGPAEPPPPDLPEVSEPTAPLSAPHPRSMTNTTADAENVEFVSQIGGSTSAVAVQGDYAYIGQGLRLTILDISNLENPIVVGKTAPMPDGVADIAVDGDHAYVANVNFGLRIVDVSDPAVPVEVGFYDTPGAAVEVYVTNSIAYVADIDSGLRLINVSDPARPIEIGVYDTPGWAKGVFVSGNIAYVADGNSHVPNVNFGLRVVDVSDPARPKEIGFYDTPGEPEGIVISGNIAYVADYDAGLRAVDVSDPTSPTEVGFYDTPGDAFSIFISGNIAYVADGVAGLRVVDVGDPTSPTEVGFYDTPGGADDVFVSGSTAYVADGSGLRVVDVGDPAYPSEISFYHTLGNVQDIVVSSNTAYVANGLDGLWAVNVSDPANPIKIGTYDTPGSARSIFISGSTAYVADGLAGLRVVDVSNPANPTEVGACDTPRFAWDVFVSSSTAYIADDDGLRGGGLRVVDVSDPANPNEVGFYNTPGIAWDVYVSGSTAYVADGDAGLRVVDVSDPMSPTEVGFYNTPGDAFSIFINGNTAYVADRGAGLRVLNVSNPANPTEVGFYDTPGTAWDVYVSGSTAYVADGRAGLRVVDVSNPANPNEVGFYDTAGYAEGVFVSNCTTYLANRSDGLTILRYTGEYAISGHVREDSGDPISSVSISADTGSVVTTYANGYYTMTGLVTGTYTLTPSKPNWVFTPLTRTVSVPPDQSGVDFIGTFAPPCDPYLTDITIVGPTGGHTGVPLRLMAFPTPQNAVTPITYTWNFGDGTFGAGQVVTHTYAASGPYTVTLQATNCVDVHAQWLLQITPPPPPSRQDGHEANDTCTQASVITTTGIPQRHSFHAAGDVDWLQFTVSEDRFYSIDVRVPPTSTADVVVEVYDSCASTLPDDNQDHTFSADVRLTYTAPTTATHYLKVRHQNSHIYGKDAVYDISIRERSTQVTAGHVIIVAGRYREPDPLQSNIHHVTDAVYRLARANGCSDDQITYLAHDATRNGVDAPATLNNLREAIAAAAQTTGPGRPLTLYMMDHGDIGKFYLNQADVITPTQLDAWLRDLQSTWLTEASVVIDACHSGSFIDMLADTPPSYMLLTSTRAQQLAYASQQGAVFSDSFINALRQGHSLLNAFEEAVWATNSIPDENQQPQLEGNCDGIPNQEEDKHTLAGRVFACSDPYTETPWPPYLKTVLTRTLGVGRLGVWSEARDDQGIVQVWAEIYPPSYQPPGDAIELAQTKVPSVTLKATSVSDIYSGTVPLTETGMYRVLLYARDEQGLVSRPKELRMRNVIIHVYLPFVGLEKDRYNRDLPSAGAQDVLDTSRSSCLPTMVWTDL